MNSAAGALVGAVLATLGAGACTDVAGGAVDLSWNLRTTDGEDTSCDATRVRRMKLWWEIDEQLGSATWRCDDVRAITAFQIPPGEALLWLEPQCANGPAAPQTYVAPPPVQRTIELGEAITLNAIIVQVQLSRCDEQACVCDVMAAR